jgi:aldehyde dehydrogenase (NAD+)
MSARHARTATDVLASLGLDPPSCGSPLPGAAAGDWIATRGPAFDSFDPATGDSLARVASADEAAYEQVMDAALARFAEWRLRPAPARGELVRKLGNRLRAAKEPLGALISLEVGKIRSEGLGEVQEMIDICDFAVGLSRQIGGLTLPSERPGHRLMEQWHPLGPVGIVTAFNFPMAVWAWNAALAAVCGDVCVWKPSPRAPLSAMAVQAICHQVMAEDDAVGLFGLVVDGIPTSVRLAADERVPLVSFTGSVAAGRAVAATVAGRLGRSILELGGNNGVVVLDDADLDLAVRAITFGAAGTAGQRCTTTRRIFAQRGIAGRLAERLVAAYRTIRVGDPLDGATLMGPLIGADAVEAYQRAVAAAIAQGGRVLCGGKAIAGPGFFVEPTLVEAPAPADFPVALDETFAPIAYLFTVDSLDEAIELHNAVPQGLSSAIFTEGFRAAERFLSAAGSDCGIANVNTGTSGAEIGGAFGGEKDTGGGRESGSDAWKAYMRRQTNTLNVSGALPLAQGVEFPVA